MPTGMAASLEKTLDDFAAPRGLPSVQAVINRAGTAKLERGKALPFTQRPWWVEKDSES